MQKTTILDRLTVVLDNADSFGPVSDAWVGDAERALGVVFPSSYRTFLRKFGASFIIAHRLAGLPDEPKSGETPIWSDVVLVNTCLLYTSPSPRDRQKSRMPSSA